MRTTPCKLLSRCIAQPHTHTHTTTTTTTTTTTEHYSRSAPEYGRGAESVHSPGGGCTVAHTATHYLGHAIHCVNVPLVHRVVAAARGNEQGLAREAHQGCAQQTALIDWWIDVAAEDKVTEAGSANSAMTRTLRQVTHMLHLAVFLRPHTPPPPRRNVRRELQQH